MEEKYKTKRQLLQELEQLRYRIADLEAREAEHHRAEDALRESENKYRTLLEHLPQRIFLKDTESFYLSCNDNYAKDLNIESDQIAGRTDIEFYPEALAEKYKADDKRVIASGRTQDFEERYIQKGREVIVHTVKTPLKDNEGRVLGVLGIFWDITIRKQAEKELQQRTHELDERIKELNCLYGISALRERPGILLEGMLRRTADLIPEAWQYPEITCARIILEGQEFRTENFKATEWRQATDISVGGQIVGTLEVHYLKERPLCDEGPFLKEERKLIDAIAERVGRMIEQQRTMVMLQTERDKLHGVLNALGEGVYIVNSGFAVEYQNEILEASFPGSTGKKCFATYMFLDAPCGNCPIGEAVESGKVRQAEAIRADGGSYDMIFSPFEDVDGEVKVIVLLRNITEKKILEAEAMRAGHLASIGELAAGVAHEINNPINGIINYAEILKEQADEANQNTEIPERIIKEGERISQIVKNLLSFARERDEEYSPARIGEILSDALGLVENQIRKDGISLSLNIPRDLPEINANSQEIQQLFLNLLSNARFALNQKYKMHHPDKSLAINCEHLIIEGRRYVRVTIHDRGPGIPADILDCICNPFFSTKRKGEGTGLGLSISHGIVNNHGGRLWFKSVEGEYTKVMVELPVTGGQSGPFAR